METVFHKDVFPLSSDNFKDNIDVKEATRYYPECLRSIDDGRSQYICVHGNNINAYYNTSGQRIYKDGNGGWQYSNGMRTSLTRRY